MRLTKEQSWRIADELIKERLDYVNRNSEPVHPSDTIYATYIKRCIDVIVSLIAILITVPINFVIFLITLFDLGSPILFAQDRTGMNGKTFKLYKFRNMRNTLDENGELLPASQRVTPMGKLLRKTSLDELLNFYSILKGDMSLIGPRPLVTQYINRYSDRHRMRLCVRPGLECPPHKRITHNWTWNEQFENDIWYVENLSFKTDLIMFLRLIQFACDRKNANARGAASRGTFIGYSWKCEAISDSELSDSEIESLLGGA